MGQLLHDPTDPGESLQLSGEDMAVHLPVVLSSSSACTRIGTSRPSSSRALATPNSSPKFGRAYPAFQDPENRRAMCKG